MQSFLVLADPEPPPRRFRSREIGLAEPRGHVPGGRARQISRNLKFHGGQEAQLSRGGFKPILADLDRGPDGEESLFNMVLILNLCQFRAELGDDFTAGPPPWAHGTPI